jgi:hypothetical protein
VVLQVEQAPRVVWKTGASPILLNGDAFVTGEMGHLVSPQLDRRGIAASSRVHRAILEFCGDHMDTALVEPERDEEAVSQLAVGLNRDTTATIG